MGTSEVYLDGFNDEGEAVSLLGLTVDAWEGMSRLERMEILETGYYFKNACPVFDLKPFLHHGMSLIALAGGQLREPEIMNAVAAAGFKPVGAPFRNIRSGNTVQLFAVVSDTSGEHSDIND
jgi:hypothetical protein